MPSESTPVGQATTANGVVTPVEGDQKIKGTKQGRRGAVDLSTTSSLEDLQTDEQRRILDTVAQVRKCGLESILSLPQLVVCGDQSAGKSSVLEALTEIPFPRSDNLCTRFATEIILRRAPSDSLTIKVIPDDQRPVHEQIKIKAFEESITDFEDLPRIMGLAMKIMGMDPESQSDTPLGAFARDVLSITIEGPNRPQLTLVDIPGLIANATKGVTEADVKMVAEITDHYISQPRTICLAVISATNDHANQPILTRVRKYDPEGDRTLGIITKPDRLPPGSGSENAFISLARNEDVFFKLGWHVLKNRKFEEQDCSLRDRNFAESTFFRTSNFNVLPKESVGIDELRKRLSRLLFEHVKQELPKLRQDLENALTEANTQLDVMGSCRSSPAECKAYLSQLSQDIYDVSKAAVDGHYEGDYFHGEITDEEFKDEDESPVSISRIRAVVQNLNTEFSETFRRVAHKYHIDLDNDGWSGFDPNCADGLSDRLGKTQITPIRWTKEMALKWVANVLARTRGRELVGNYNPLLVGELFWEQSSKWQLIAVDHIECVADQCSKFLKTLLHDKCPKDVESRLWDSKIHDALKERSRLASEELAKIMEDIKGYPINYNHYYTDTIKSRRQNRQRIAIKETAEKASKTTRHPEEVVFESPVVTTTVDIDQFVQTLAEDNDSNMENFSCEEALDCLFAIYKVSQKTFIANITTQVIERHIVRGLQNIFSPVVVNAMSDVEVEAIASEPLSAKRQREFLEERIKKLTDGHEIFRGVMGSGGK
ncbi:dynamin family protein-like protein [Hyaloscypha bicolor E]|uniref:Dynamin family protein-like protein n=1 Tax=Hyaloscypha bicolor E TaxID=1095630 RepID=A0A2J6T2Q7_9HELO|nr:dynamin family protein-like protein [Hyaloscypha bicolor E]PMD57289.1 dynamin family protein-like protein [Hyaloscypha bicolor E]